jgi:hypothetical protein
MPPLSISHACAAAAMTPPPQQFALDGRMALSDDT